MEKLIRLSREWGIKPEELEAEAVDDILDKYERKRKLLTGRCAMVVDDSAMMRIMLEDSLSRAGVKVTAKAENGFDAVKIFNGDEHYDFVFLNVVMPAMDGVEALEDFKREHRSRIIMVTSTKHPGLLLTAVKNGAHHILYRPFGNRELLEVMTCERIFNKSLFPALRDRLASMAGNMELSQNDVRDLIKICHP
jgi:CheY-like chemotaxis protein